MFGLSKDQVNIWVNRIQSFVFLNDPILRRNRELSNNQNLVDFLEEAHQATLTDRRTVATYNHLSVPNTRLCVIAIDSRAVKISKSQDYSLQHRSYSTKITNNAVSKMTLSSMEGLPLISFPLLASISPAGTDESNCEHLGKFSIYHLKLYYYFLLDLLL